MSLQKFSATSAVSDVTFTDHQPFIFGKDCIIWTSVKDLKAFKKYICKANNSNFLNSTAWNTHPKDNLTLNSHCKYDYRQGKLLSKTITYCLRLNTVLSPSSCLDTRTQKGKKATETKIQILYLIPLQQMGHLPIIEHTGFWIPWRDTSPALMVMAFTRVQWGKRQFKWQ